MADAISNLPGETWKPVVGWEGLYEVSSEGRLKTLKRTIQTKHGVLRTRGARVLKANITNHGYVMATLTRNGCQHYETVHRLVLKAFVGPCPPGMEACHGNGVRTDNRLINLRWATHSENEADKRLHGTNCAGSKCGSAKLTESQVRSIKAMLSRGLFSTAIGRMLGIPASTVQNIKNGSTWSYVTI